MTRITREDANNYVKVIREMANQGCLSRILLFGSVAMDGEGSDLDIILEVPEATFVEFAGKCIGALDGFHPVMKTLLPMASFYWNYYSPALARFEHALAAIGIDPEDEKRLRLSDIVPDKQVDTLCLPEGWQTPGFCNGLLERHFGDLGDDPEILTNVIHSAIEM